MKSPVAEIVPIDPVTPHVGSTEDVPPKRSVRTALKSSDESAERLAEAGSIVSESNPGDVTSTSHEFASSGLIFALPSTHALAGLVVLTSSTHEVIAYDGES